MVEDLEAVHPGQPDVEDHQVEVIAQCEVETLGAVLRDDALMAFGTETLGDERCDARLVLDDQDAGHDSSSSSGVSAVKSRVITKVAPVGSDSSTWRSEEHTSELQS